MSRSEKQPHGDQPVTHFYLEPDNIKGDTCRFSREESNHLAKALRREEGSEVLATDGRGTIYTVRLAKIIDRRVQGRIVSAEPGLNELPFAVSFAFGMQTMGKNEQVIDQLTQLGVNEIIPLTCRRSAVTLSQSRVSGKLERWQRVAVAAMKQSLRAVLPGIREPQSATQLLEILPGYDLVFIGSLGAGGKSGSVDIQSGMRILLISGPEEGLSEDEETALISAGARPVRLGARRLRAELAPIVLMTALVARSEFTWPAGQ